MSSGSHEGGGVTGGMRGAGYYDAHSEYQRRVIEAGDSLLRRLSGELELPDGPDAEFTLADYGAGTGATSVHAVATALEALREPGHGIRFTAIHNDVIENDFGSLFETVAGDSGYLRAGDDVLPMASAGSFFSPVAPRSSVDLGMCSNASHWFRAQPDVDAPGALCFADAPQPARERLARLAADDWLSFLQARATELKPGGHLLVQGIATSTGGDGSENVSAARLLRVMNSVAEELVDAGLLRAEALDGYVFPVYCRAPEEALAPIVDGGALEGAFTRVHLDTIEVANPYWELLERDDDRDAYADSYTAFVRAFAEATLVTHLFEPGAIEIDPARLCEEFFARFRQASASNPDAGRYEAWITRIILRRL